MFLTEKVKVTEIKKGDLIRSRDIELQEDCYREVLATMEPIVEDQIEIRSGEYSVCTSETHPMAIVKDGVEQYTETKNVSVNDIIITPEGYKKVDFVVKGNYDKNFIDFTVDKENNYYAGNDKDKLILAHNSATCYYPIWHLEIESLLVLKNNKGIDENRVRHMDYCVQFNKLFYERLINNENITLFSPSDVPGLYESFFNDQDKFRELYETAERNTRIRKKTISAVELFSMFMQERKDTGRIYLMNVDHCNKHSSFKEDIAPIHMSNLCLEITLPTKPLNDINDEEGEIALCTLSAINWGAFKKPEEMEKACTLAVRGLDALLSYQHYPVLAAKYATEKRRPLGIGIINFAYWLAKHNSKYTDPDLELVDTWAQHWSYYLIKASVDLAKDFGPCQGNNETKYSDGILPLDTRKKEVDELIKHTDKVDWTSLRKELKEFGIRNSTLMALMPAETSAQIANATNGIEPPRNYVSVKQSKDGVLTQVVPEYRRLKNKYELLWNQRSPEGYLKIVAVLQKYIDQTISANTSYNPQHFEDEQIPMSVLLGDILKAYSWGIKTLYYCNLNDGQGEVDVTYLDEQCDSCTI